MGVDLFLYCKSLPSWEEIEKVVFDLGFRVPGEVDSILTITPGPPLNNSEVEKLLAELGDQRQYIWYEETDNTSLRGCWLEVTRGPLKDGDIPRSTRTLFVTSTPAGRSYEDLEMQNTALRRIKSTFGGSIFDPQGVTGT